MNETIAARNFIVDFLRKELVGPFPGYPVVQINGQEILPAQEPPRQKYSAGILFPMRSDVIRQNETGLDEKISKDAETPYPNTTEDLEIVDLESTQINSDDNSSDTDRDVTLANQFLPSAMGISALLDVPEVLVVDVSAAIYRQEELLSHNKVTRNGKQAPKAWWRQPIDCSIELFSDDLIGSGTKTLEKSVFRENGHTVLALHVVSRPHAYSTDHQQSRLITFSLVNRRTSTDRTPKNSACFFQCGLSVRQRDGQACFLKYPGPHQDTRNIEELSLQLLYQHRGTFAVGHGCAAEWTSADERATCIRTEVLPTYEIKPVLPTQIEGLDLRMIDLMEDSSSDSITLCRKLADKYETWIIAREKEIDSREDLTPDLKETGYRHMTNCRECLRRMRDGLTFLEEDPDVALAFRLMNEAMLKQSVHYTIASKQPRKWEAGEGGPKLKKPFVRPIYTEPQWDRHWRPFQLAFILMNLKPIANPDCTERSIVDVIWFPTGGGKTEAYLGLASFSIFLRRLRNPDYAGTSILMRYTLRLLTTQQFQRAASLICACEVIRLREEARLGPQSFSIGLWVGSEVTPNTEKDALEAWRKIQKRNGDGVNKFIILSCPWCGAAMGPQKIGKKTLCKGYKKLAHPNRIRHICEDPDCDFNSGDGLPLAVIDEHIYELKPTLLIGTVDKFALLAFRPQARKLFGIDTHYPPPELIIQDELHLISGPLGSMVGHYEAVINALCIDERKGKRIPAKIIASTATISRAESQVQRLYGRNAFLFPPQALKAGDSFLAQERDDKTGRLYVGVFATALTSHVTAQVRTMGALLQAPRLFGASSAETIDPYWTLMGYFNSLRELGYAATLIHAEIREYINGMCNRLGLFHGMTKDKGTDPRRFIKRKEELTSRVQSSQIPAILQRLFTPYDKITESDVVDVCFATNMIQVGLDVPRLSMMTIVGQPKTTSEYIQASSRVGRDITRPGIVVINYNPFKPRDRSHYEHFRSYHNSIYRHVEPTSVTPFAIPVRERALHALVFILCRFWGDAELRDRPSRPPSPELVQKIKESIRERVMSADPSEWLGTDLLIDDIVDRWSTTCPSKWGDFGLPDEEMPLMYPSGRQTHPDWHGWPYATPSSMRNVDAVCAARPLFKRYGERYSLE